MKPISKYITSYLLFGWIVFMAGQSGYAQAILTDSIPKSKMFIPTFIRVGGDLLGPARSVISETQDAWEVQAEMDIYRYFLSVEFGSESNFFDEATYSYSSEGTYNRFGVDINLLHREAFGSSLFFGIRFGKSTFDEAFSGSAFNPEWGDIEFDLSNEKVKARWKEIVTGMKGKVWKNLYLGYILRLRLSPKITYPNGLNLDTFQVPGYGRADQRNSYGVNYYVAWQFSFRQKYMRPRKP